MTMYGDWDKFQRKITTLPARLDKILARVTAKIAHELRKDWVNGIRNQTLGLAPNAPATNAGKRSSTPLVDHGDLLGSIRPYKKVNEWFVGILKGAKTDNGSDLVNVANVLEYGSDGPITPKNATYLCIPMTRAASRVGSPRNWGDDELIFLNDPRTEGAAFVHAETEEIMYILVKSVEITPRPAMRIVYMKFLPKMKKAYADAIRKEVYAV